MAFAPIQGHPPPIALSGVVWRGRLRLSNGHDLELSLHLFFLLTLCAMTWLLGEALFPRLFPGWPPSSYWLVALAVAFTDSLAALLHELGHAAAAIAKGRQVYRITLYGVAAAARRSSGAARPRDQVAIAIAGPLSHLLVASFFWATWSLLPVDDLPLRVATGFPAVSNAALGLLNLLPVSPLDGGRVVRALVAVRLGL